MKIGLLHRAAIWIFLALAFPSSSPGQVAVRAVPDNMAYNVGTAAKVRVIFPGSPPARPIKISARILYAGESRPVMPERVIARSVLLRAGANSTDFLPLWTVPRDARTGLYAADLIARDQESGSVVFDLSPAVSFAVYRKLVRILRVEPDRTFYQPGDPVAVRVTLANESGRPQTGLRVEFSERYWPWIAQTSERAGVDVFTLAKDLSLPAVGARSVASGRAALAPDVKEPSVYQYAVVVWDRPRKDIFDIAFSPLVFVNPPGISLPKPYAGVAGAPLQYLHSNLDSIDFTRYRNFYPPALASAAIEFDRSHTMFASGSPAEIQFKARNPGLSGWHNTSIRIRWLDPGQHEISTTELASGADFPVGGSPLNEQAKIVLPAGVSGIFRAQAEIAAASGGTLASSTLELGVNPLPKSILIFCAHEDDEGAHHGILRAAVENHIPIHLVYFTGGDAGSCDRYYQHSCAPAESLNFGELRMEEARKSLGHLGVPREDIFFLGLPDGGSGQVWFDAIGPAHPYMSVMLAADHAPYPDVARPNLPFARDAVVQAAKEFIQRFRPEVIYTGHPDERHVDHRTNNWFVMRALDELSREGALSPEPVVLVDQSYGPGPQKHAPYHYEKQTFYVSGDAATVGQEAAWFYQSQDGNRAEGNRRDYVQLRRSEVHWRILDWKEHAHWNDQP